MPDFLHPTVQEQPAPERFRIQGRRSLHRRRCSLKCKKKIATVVEALFYFSNFRISDFCSPHYGVEFRLDVVDASTDTVVGTTTLTTHRLLQDQRDHVLGSKISLLQFAGGPLRWKGLRPMLLELQTKSRGSVDLFGTSKQGGTSPHSSHVESSKFFAE